MEASESWALAHCGPTSSRGDTSPYRKTSNRQRWAAAYRLSLFFHSQIDQILSHLILRQPIRRTVIVPGKPSHSRQIPLDGLGTPTAEHQVFLHSNGQSRQRRLLSSSHDIHLSELVFEKQTKHTQIEWHMPPSTALKNCRAAAQLEQGGDPVVIRSPCVFPNFPPALE